MGTNALEDSATDADDDDCDATATEARKLSCGVEDGGIGGSRE